MTPDRTLVGIKADCKTAFPETRIGNRGSEEARVPTMHAGLQTDGGTGREHDVRILAVDDHGGFREALRDLIRAAPGFVLVGQACSGEEAVLAVESLVPDLVLMDVAMPGMGGIAATREILSRRPEMVVVLISVDDPALHPDAGVLRAVAYARKQDLAPRGLGELWEWGLALRARSSASD